MTNNQINRDLEPNDNQLSDEELEQVAGGGKFSDIVDAGKEFIEGVIDEGKEFISDVSDAFKRPH